MIHLNNRKPPVVCLVALALAAAVFMGAILPVLETVPGAAMLTLVLLILGLLRILNVSFLRTLIFLIPWQIYLVNWPGSTFTLTGFEILLLLCILSTLGKLLHRGRLAVHRELLALLFLIVMGATSGLVGGYVADTLKFLLDWALPLSLYWLIRANEEQLSAGDVLRLLVLSMSLQAVLGLTQFAVGDPATIKSVLREPFSRFLFDPDMLAQRLWRDDFNWIYQGRAFAFGTFISGVYFAFFTACFGCLALGLAAADKRRAPLTSPYVYAGILLVVASLAAFKRTGWVSIAVGLTVLLVMSQRDGTRWARVGRSVLVTVAAIVAPIALLLVAQGSLVARAFDQTGTALSRVAVWGHYMSVLARHPILGIGPAFQQEAGYGVSTFWGGMPAATAATSENTYLNLALQAGIPGLLAFLWFVLGPLFRLWPRSRRPRSALAVAVFAWCAAYLVGGFFLNGVGDPSSTSLLVVMVWTARRVAVASPGSPMGTYTKDVLPGVRPMVPHSSRPAI